MVLMDIGGGTITLLVLAALALRQLNREMLFFRSLHTPIDATLLCPVVSDNRNNETDITFIPPSFPRMVTSSVVQVFPSSEE